MAPPGKIGCLIWFSGDLPTKPSFQSYSRSYSTPPAAEREGQRNSDIFYRDRLNSRIKLFQRHWHKRQTNEQRKNQKEKAIGQRQRDSRAGVADGRKEASDSTDSGGSA